MSEGEKEREIIAKYNNRITETDTGRFRVNYIVLKFSLKKTGKKWLIDDCELLEAKELR